MSKNKLPVGWKEVEFSEVVVFQEGPGVRNYQFTNKGIKLLNVRNIVSGELVLENTVTHISFEEARGKYKHFLVDEGDIIMASSGVTWGKTALVKKKDLPLCMNTSTIRFKILDDKKILKNYLLIFLNSFNFKRQIEKMITGGCQPNFGPSHLKQVKILLPPLPIQHKIVSILEKAELLKQKRAEADKLANQYLKSVFVELFGVESKFENVKIKDIILKTENFSPEKNFPEKYFEYIDISSIDNKVGQISSSNKILGKDAPSRAKQKIKYDDLIISTVRPNLNAVALIPKKLDNQICSTGFCVIRADKTKALSEYLYQIARSTQFIESMNKIAKGASYPAVSDGDIKNYEISLPPLPLQQKFASFVESVERMKEKQKQSKELIDNLFDSLMQKAFKGELAI